MTISYGIELHDITSLTEPMWEACGIECPAMIGADCPGGMDCPGWSAQFASAAAEVVRSWTRGSGQSDDCGDAVDGDAWYALFRNPDAGTYGGPMGAGVILCVTSHGFVGATRFGTAEALEEDWRELRDEASRWVRDTCPDCTDEAACPEHCDCGEC